MGNKSFRIKYDKDSSVDHLNVKLDQDFDFLEVLSLKISQEDTYKLYTSGYGVLVGRVLANDGFGVPNAKISIFIKNEEIDETDKEDIIYPYTSVSTKNQDDIRYNLLPSEKVSNCHQNVGTFPSKRTLIDNDSQIDVFDKFYKYTTVTNESGDYMIFGVPVGQQQIHVDVDLSDIGVLSQTPRDMEYKGYSLKQFDSPNKFKKSTNLDSLSQIITENTTVFIYPFWGDESEGEIAISKKNINLQYKFEPTCVFMGSIFSDSEKNGISKSCKPSKTAGQMSEMVASQGLIEMIRKTIDNNVEFYDINGNRQINNNGVWCYQIPMNLDYVITDEYGNIRPTDDPNKGIPTRAEVRFRVKMDDNGDEFIQNKTAAYLIPNNPKEKKDEDYEFGSSCKDTSFVSLMWNKVYSVKNYSARIQKNKRNILGGRGTEVKNRRFLGIKGTNYHESNNPIPYNNIYVNITLKFMLLCLITKLIINAGRLINNIISWIRSKFTIIVCAHICIDTKMLGDCDSIQDITDMDYYVPVGRYTQNKLKNKTIKSKPKGSTFAYEGKDTFYGSVYYIDRIESCIETSLASENEVVNFDFTNDWINGCLYAPRFLTKSKKNKKTGELLTYYCGSDTENDYSSLSLIQTCAPSISSYGAIDSSTKEECKDHGRCFKKNKKVTIGRGNIVKSSDGTYYYRSIEFEDGNKLKDKYIQPTGVVLLGSFVDCDQDGIPQLHQLLPSTTFKLPPDSVEVEENGSFVETPFYEYVYLYDVHNYSNYEELYDANDDRLSPSKGVVYYTEDEKSYYIWNGGLIATGDTFITGWTTGEIITGFTSETQYNEFVKVKDEGTTAYIQKAITSGYTIYNEIWTVPSGQSSQFIPEISGIDWGNKADNLDGKVHFENGLFVGVNCVDSDTYTKTCVNASRLCELGVDFDERQQFANGLISGNTEVDGYITQDEVSDGDARAMFATLNINDLNTKNINGQYKYDFKYLYPDGFDGRLRSLTGDTSSSDYLNFRFGSRYSKWDDNLRNMYYSYDVNSQDYSFPKYENSFYFYFGLKAGNTALDLFNTQYFVPCSETKQDKFKIFLSLIKNEELCQGNDGIIKIKLKDILFPCNIYFNNEKYVGNWSGDEIEVSGLTSQYYTVKVTDANENPVSSTIFLPRNNGVEYNYGVKHSSDITIPNGSITISGITNENSDLDEYTYNITGTNKNNEIVNLISGNFTGSTYEITGLTGGSYSLIVKEKNCDNNFKNYDDIRISEPPRITLSGATLTPNKNGIVIENIKQINDGGGSGIIYGICYKETDDINYIPTTGDTVVIGATGYIGSSYGVTITNLNLGLNYRIRGYAISNYGLSYSDTSISGRTLSDAPTIMTSQVVNITNNSASPGGNNITSNGEPIIEQGILLSSTETNVTLNVTDIEFNTGGSLTNNELYSVNTLPIGITKSGNQYIVSTGLTDEIRFNINYKARINVRLRNSVGSNETWQRLMDTPTSIVISHPFYNGYDTINLLSSYGYNLYLYLPNGGNTGYIVTGGTDTVATEFPISISSTGATYIVGTPIDFGVITVGDGWIDSPININSVTAYFDSIGIIFTKSDTYPIIMGTTYKDTDELGNSSFTIPISGLTSNSTYYTTAYARNNIGSTYASNQISFNTLT